MYELLGSKSKEIVFLYLVNNPNQTIKEITAGTKLQYKYVFKIITEFLEKSIVDKNNKTYALAPKFVEFYRKTSDKISEKYIDSIFMRNKLDLYNAFCSLEDDKGIKSKVDKIIGDWFYNKLDEWYSKYYDPENIELKKIISTIEDKFESNKDIRILEIGCGTGRTSFELEKQYKNYVAIDSSKEYITYCNKKSKKLKQTIDFKYADIKKFKSNEKFDVILFDWVGLHHQKNIDKILDNVKTLSNKEGLLVILDAYHDSEYVEILQSLREVDLNKTKLKKEVLSEKLVKKFETISQDTIKTFYKFTSIKNVIENFKIELTLEESHIWTKKDEENLKEYLSKKKEPLVIGEGFTLVKIDL